MLRNFEKFEVGHYYVYTGNKSEVNWNSSGKMDFALKHEILQCSNDFKSTSAFADFRGYEKGLANGWDWSDGFDDWVEVESPDAMFEVGDTVLTYISKSIVWKKDELVGKCYVTQNKRKNGYAFDYFVHYILKRKTKESKVTQEETVVWKDNSFKKYIRKKKYLAFSKKKKHAK